DVQAQDSSKQRKRKKQKKLADQKEILRKTQILIRNLYRLRMHIRLKKMELEACQDEHELSLMFRAMNADLAVLLNLPIADDDDAEQEPIDARYYDPLTISALLTS